MRGNFQGYGVLEVLVFLVGVMVRITSYCSGEPIGLVQGKIPVENIQQRQLQNTGANTVSNNGLFGGALNRQGGGLSFAIPGLSLLAGNNGVGGGGNIFGVVTVTRTLVSTVSTVTTASWRTCIAPTNALTACPAGRKKRSAVEENQFEQVKPTPAMVLIIGSTTVKDPEAVSDYLEAHKPSNQSVIYPPGLEQEISEKLKINPRLDMEEEQVTTPLYPSQDTPEEEDIVGDEANQHYNDQVFNNAATTGTETPELINDDLIDITTYTPESDDNFQGNDDAGSDDKARVGLGRTTTVTTIIRVTSVATSIATGGTTATLTVSYTGCLPPSLPVSGMPCP